jgi:hypothetical protein
MLVSDLQVMTGRNVARVTEPPVNGMIRELFL